MIDNEKAIPYNKSVIFKKWKYLFGYEKFSKDDILEADVDDRSTDEMTERFDHYFKDKFESFNYNDDDNVGKTIFEL